MKKFLLLLLTGLFSFSLFSQESINYSGESTKPKLARFVSIKSSHGTVLPTNNFVTGDYRIPYYNALSLKYGISSSGNTWQEHVFGMPYMGIGVSGINYYRKDNLGIPITVYFFQGGHLTDFNKRVSLNYEWNAGASFNWKHYDPFTNPDNVAIGSTVNIYAGVNLYMKWKISNKLDLNAGVEFEHFSNGAYQYPNYGINQTSGFIELAYYFNRENTTYGESKTTPPPFTKSKDHDFMLLISSRHAQVDTIGTGLASKYTQRNFTVLGASYAYMFNYHPRYRIGPSVEFTYDESAGVKSWREYNPADGKTHDRVKLGDFGNRFSLGLSVKGEVRMPMYSAFLNIGYDLIHAKESDGRLYQIFGVKVFFKENLYGVFGIRATDFGKSQYMFVNFGITLKTKERSLLQLT